MKTLLILSTLLIALIIAPYNRIVKATDSAIIADQTDPSPAIPELFFEKEVSELVSLGSIAAANQGPYMISGYRHRECPGSIALLPLYRNAEGSQILRKLVSDQQQAERIRYGVLFKGSVHRDFPQFAFALEKLSRGLQQLPPGTTDKPIKILAFAEQGQCQLAEKLARYTF